MSGPVATVISVPADTLSALGRLNSHARAWGSGKRAIYAYKTLAATMLAIGGHLTRTEFVEWSGQCRGCSGTGHYVDSYGEKWPHCRACRSSGTVTLKFFETVLPDGQTWHHPWDKSGRGIAEAAGACRWDSISGKLTFLRDGKPVNELWWRPNHWTPNQPGRQLEPEEAAAALNVVEAWVLGLKDSAGVDPACRWLLETALAEMRRYGLGLGRIGEKCWYCESRAIVTGLCSSLMPIEWCAPVCADHKNIPVACWPKVLPDGALTPAVNAWRERHERLGVLREDYIEW